MASGISLWLPLQVLSMLSDAAVTVHHAANFPDLFMPGFNEASQTFLVAAGYMLVVNVFLFNLLLAVTTAEYASIHLCRFGLSDMLQILEPYHRESGSQP